MKNEQQNGQNTEQIIQRISDALSDMLHGPQRDNFEQMLSQNPTPEAVAEMLYQPARAHIENAEKRYDVDEAFIYGVVTDAIDMALEMIEAMGKLDMKPEEFREAAFWHILMIHNKDAEDTPETRAMAMENLAQMEQDGMTGQAQQIMSRKAGEQGVDVRDFERVGSEMMAPQQGPLATGIRQGLEG